jgi:hypothetical protein
LSTSVKKALTPYICFVKENRGLVASENPNKPSKELM